jgi:hypothetical protein
MSMAGFMIMAIAISAAVTAGAILFGIKMSNK